MLQEKIINCRKVRSYFIVPYDKAHIAGIAQVTVPQTYRVEYFIQDQIAALNHRPAACRCRAALLEGEVGQTLTSPKLTYQE